MNKKMIISHLIALVLGLVGGFLGRDLSGLQKPAEDVVEKVVEAKADAGPAVVVPVADAGTK